VTDHTHLYVSCCGIELGSGLFVLIYDTVGQCAFHCGRVTAATHIILSTLILLVAATSLTPVCVFKFAWHMGC
jgi:hypothetical protein